MNDHFEAAREDRFKSKDHIIWLPKDAIGKVFCPVCRGKVRQMRLYQKGKNMRRLWALPCSHEINPIQEQAMVNDMLMKGL